jgi:glycosyltransferase involved in cell wall biosynthesis
MTRLVFDLIALQPEGTSPVSGGGEYARRVFAAVARQVSLDARNRPDHAGPGSSVVGIARSDAPLDPNVSELAAQAGIPIRWVRRPLEVGSLLAEVGATRFFSALPLRYAAPRGEGVSPVVIPEGCEFVYTVHGLRPLELPWDRDELRYATSPRAILRHLIPRLAPRWYGSRRRAQFRHLFSLARDQRIITVSDHTRTSLLATFPELRRSAVPVHTLYSPPEEAPGDLAGSDVVSSLTPDSFYLVITANRWGKNGARAVDALQQLYAAELLDRPTVLVGVASHGRTAPYIRRLRRGPQAEKFVLMDYVPRRDLELLYARARGLIFPTLNEGFGYPPLECMALGTPVITSGINSIPELTGDAALLCNPWSVAEIAARILQLEGDPETVARLREAGPLRAAVVEARQKEMLGELVQLLLA